MPDIRSELAGIRAEVRTGLTELVSSLEHLRQQRRDELEAAPPDPVNRDRARARFAGGTPHAAPEPPPATTHNRCAGATCGH
jgi:hypothetical protein